MATLPKTFLTPEQYLEIERKAETKSQYYDGEMFAMSGVSRVHDLIAGQLHLLVGQHLRGKEFCWHTSGMRIRIAPRGPYVYPDLSATCEEPQYADPHVDMLVNPALVVEILSPSTEAHDRGRKAKLYRSMPSLREVLLIAQDSHDVELHRRQQDGRWVILEAGGLEASIELESISYTLRLRELYENVPA
jgi:Uma2 family endonuclease